MGDLFSDLRLCKTPGCANIGGSLGSSGKRDCYCYGCRRVRQGKPRSRTKSRGANVRIKRRKVAILRRLAFEYLGGKCSNPNCPITFPIPPAAYDFHHRDPSTKSFGIGNVIIRGASWEKIRRELDKCDLLCCLCHRLLHAGQNRDS